MYSVVFVRMLNEPLKSLLCGNMVKEHRAMKVSKRRQMKRQNKSFKERGTDKKKRVKQTYA